MKKSLVYLRRWWFWAISRLFSWVYLRPKFKLDVRDSDKKLPRRPFVMVCNHATFFDPWLCGHLSRYPLSIMMNEEGFHNTRFVQWYLKHIGAFPKKKGESDVRAMKYTLSTLKEGYPVLIFPEGQTTWDGETQPVFKGIESIIQRVKLPLVMMRIAGNFISKPWWAETYRQGKVTISRRIVPAEDIQGMSKEAIRQMVIDYIHNNDFTNDEIMNATWTGPPATEGLTRFLWLCRQCGAEGTLDTTEDGVACASCHAEWAMDNRFHFTPRNEAPDVGTLYDYARWHKQQVKSRIAAAGAEDVLIHDTGVHHVDVTDLGEYPTQAVGTLTLTKQWLRFTPEGDGAGELALPVTDINDYVFQLKTIFECRCNQEVYKFRFEPGSPMKWVYYFRYLNNYEECERRGYI